MKCLIIEDNIHARRDYVSLADACGYESFDVAEIAAASYLLRTHEFELIILELVVGADLTLGLIDYLAVIGAQATVILVTGSMAFPHGEIRHICPRIDYVFRKPANLGDISAVIDHCRTRCAAL